METNGHETAADRLREAAGMIRRGHRRGAMVDAWGNRCANGAILRIVCGRAFTSVDKRYDRDPVAAAAADALAEALMTNPAYREALTPHLGVMLTHHRIAYWNDMLAADKIEVAETMEKVAAQIEERV